ncbi:MAG TPA: BTAD domain-containing putative transcriptional regulator [Streptosporangiaceae bacterium]
MYFGVLGPLRVHDGVREIHLTAPKQRALLAGLLVTAGQIQDSDRLIDVLWGDQESGSRSALQMQMVRLRQTVGDRIAGRIVTRPGGYLIEAGPDELDVSRFLELCDNGRRAAREGNWQRAAQLLRDSLDLWSGNPLQDVPSERLHTRYVPHLAEMRLLAIESSIDARLNLAEHDNLVGELRELVRHHPLRERFAAQLMIAQYRSGRRADALEVYRDTRQQLVTELGIEPGAELQALHQQILSGEEAGGQGPDRVRLARSRPAPAQLPADVGDFTGRTGYVDDLSDRLARCADTDDGTAVTVVVVSGPAGVGKTTLAIHAGHLHRRRFPDGQLYVNLGGAGGQPVSPEEVLGRFLRDLGLDWSAVPRDADERAVLYRSMTSDSRMLIVLDDARSGAQVRPLIPAGRGNAVLITSRRRLASLDAVHHMPLDVLGTREARAMFTRVVGDARVDAEPDSVNRVLAICAGLPLALRIAAARLASQPDRTIGELADRLADTAHRLDVLHVEDRAVRASFQVSYADLAGIAADGSGRQVMRAFRLLGLWDGPTISLPAAAALTGQPIPVTEALAETLIEANLLESRTPHRYQFHDLMRIYARERAEYEEARSDRELALRRLFNWYLRTADRASGLIEPERYDLVVPAEDPAVVPLDFQSRQQAVSWCDSESANLVAATRQQARHGFDSLVWQLPSVLAPYYNLRKLWADWIATHKVGLASADRDSDLLGMARMLTGLGRAYNDLQRFEEALSSYRQALILYRRVGDESGALRTLINLTCLYGTRGQPEAVITAGQEALKLARDVADMHSEAVVLGNLACAHMQLGHGEEAIQNLQLALAVRQNRNDLYGQAIVHHNLGDVYRTLLRDEESADHLGRALKIRREIGDRYGEALTLAQFGELFRQRQRHDEAREHLTGALRIFEDIAAPEAAEIKAALSDLE